MQAKSRELDFARSALAILMDSNSGSTRQKIEKLLTATVFMKRAFWKQNRLDLVQKLEVIDKKLLSKYLVNWELLEKYRAEAYIPREVKDSVKKLQRELLEVEALRRALLELLIDAGV
ncbi:MAG: hypothetical protein J7L34_04185 [Thermotogaceae bacterium]|nr:hypothetical protein [Thermotogaceae bacterium]